MISLKDLRHSDIDFEFVV